MSILTEDEIEIITQNKVTYKDKGFSNSLHRYFPEPYRSPDELGTTNTNVGRKIPVVRFDPREFIEKSDVAIVSFTLPANLRATITMRLDLKFEGLTIAIPRWSIYSSVAGVETEITAPPLGLDYTIFPTAQNYEATKDLDNTHILKVGVREDIGSDQDFVFRGEWVFIGDLVGGGAA